MMKLKNILGITVVLMATVTLQAQTYNDSVRVRTWSVYMQGGISSYHGVRSELFDNSKRTMAPDLNLGVKYNIQPWVRLGVNAGYTMLKSSGNHSLSITTTDHNFLIGDRTGTLELKSDRLQNLNNTYLAGVDANADFNILEIWPKRKAQWLSLYAGAGVGYMRGWNRNSQTLSYNERATATGDAYFNGYSHSYLKSSEDKKHFNALYIPLSLSLEFDIQRQLTLGVIGQYKCIPTKSDFSPKGIYSAGVVIRYNFVKSKSKLQRKQIADLYSELDASQVDCASAKATLQRQSREEMERLKKEADELKRQIESINSTAAGKGEETSAIIYFENDSWELSSKGGEQLQVLAEKLKTHPEKKIMLISSANTVGHENRNKKLSSNRLNTVKQFLLSQGVSDTQFKTEVSLGDYGMTTSSDCRRVIVITQP